MARETSSSGGESLHRAHGSTGLRWSRQVSGWLLSLIAAYAVGRWEQRVTKVEFEGVAATELIVMQNGINEYLSRLVTLRTLFESTNEEVTGASSRFSVAACCGSSGDSSRRLAAEGQPEGAGRLRGRGGQ